MTEPAEAPSVAFKIIAAAEWRRAVSEGTYDGSAVDLADGYIHMSTADQLSTTAEKHYAGQTDLMLLSVDLDQVGDELVWEPSRGGALFPHLYGSLPTGAVTSARACAVSPEGRFVFADPEPSA
ncbi:glutathione S-transferase [Brevundimonas sp. LM2]|uniref:DUF952 domain-containing protein n=1 Tax=Brevundimonas sp. LM2 TaxID=1938605 RepID=UPI000983FD0F|nr:DUF952 domain-containing protein [Brevundimonas sp. LM2]AQR60942.1 glutathione S-transferase [Brevundimonas sp. LM2]